MKTLKEMFYSGAILGVLVRDNPKALDTGLIKTYARYIGHVLDNPNLEKKDLEEILNCSVGPYTYSTILVILEDYKTLQV